MVFEDDVRPADGGSVGVKALRAALAVAAAAKIDVAALTERHGLAHANLDDPDQRYGHHAWVSLWDDIERLSGDPGIGLHAAAAMPIGQWDVVDYLIASSETIGDGLTKLARYFPLISTAVDHVVCIKGDEARIVRRHRPGTSRSRPASELVIASIVLRFRMLASAPWTPRSVAFAYAPSVATDEYERLFECKVSFDQPADVIVLDREVLSIRMKRPEAGLNAVLERHAHALLAQMPKLRPSVVDRVKGMLLDELPSGAPPLSRAAKRLGMSARTFQRRLAEAGIDYSELVEQTRETIARRYVADSSIGLGEIAFLVGFGDISAFYKAFRRWTGQTPGAYRAARARH